MRIIVERDDRASTIRLEGALSGPWVGETERVWHAETASGKERYLQIELSEVTFIDTRGKELLERFFDSGADLIAGTLLSRSIVDEINPRRRRRNGKRAQDE